MISHNYNPSIKDGIIDDVLIELRKGDYDKMTVGKATKILFSYIPSNFDECYSLEESYKFPKELFDGKVYYYYAVYSLTEEGKKYNEENSNIYPSKFDFYIYRDKERCLDDIYRHFAIWISFPT